MPNAHDYRAAALRLRHLAVQVSHEMRVLRAATDPSGIAGGPVQVVLRQGIDEALASVVRAAEELGRLASICDRRAEICAVHAAERRRYELHGWSTPPPDPPAWWVGDGTTARR